MEDFLGNIYCWFESIFGSNLADHLWGYDCLTQSYSNPNIFNQIGSLTIFIALFLVIIFYYIINHPRFNRWWNWLIILGVAGLICLIIGYAWTINDFLNGNISDCLMYTRDENNNIISQHIFKTDCWMFGLANMFVSFLFFIVFSLTLKWGSRNCKHSPVL